MCLLAMLQILPEWKFVTQEDAEPLSIYTPGQTASSQRQSMSHNMHHPGTEPQQHSYLCPGSKEQVMCRCSPRQIAFKGHKKCSPKTILSQTNFWHHLSKTGHHSLVKTQAHQWTHIQSYFHQAFPVSREKIYSCHHSPGTSRTRKEQ